MKANPSPRTRNGRAVGSGKPVDIDLERLLVAFPCLLDSPLGFFFRERRDALLRFQRRQGQLLASERRVGKGPAWGGLGPGKMKFTRPVLVHLLIAVGKLKADMVRVLDDGEPP